jgi:O-antigen ligase
MDIEIRYLSRARMSSALCGIVDASVWISFLFTLDSTLYYAMSMLFKIMAVGIHGSPRHPRPIFVAFVVPVVFAEMVSLGSGWSDLSSVLVVLPFIVSLGVTVSIVDKRELVTYLRWFSGSIFVSILAFLAMWASGKLEAEWGRWFYLGGAHPNLGGEIVFAGAVAAALRLPARSWFLWIYLILAIWVVTLLQSRAALIAIAIVGTVTLYNGFLSGFLSGFGVALRAISITSVILGALVLFLVSHGSDFFVSVLQLDDEYRGIGTGFVGRDERWEFAWNTFLASPLFGVGFGYFRDAARSDLTPHNFVMHMLGEMGALSLVCVVSLVYGAYKLTVANRNAALICASAIVLTVFNDRFINLNPYPFILYVILFLRSEAWKEAKI